MKTKNTRDRISINEKKLKMPNIKSFRKKMANRNEKISHWTRKFCTKIILKLEAKQRLGD